MMIGIGLWQTRHNVVFRSVLALATLVLTLNLSGLSTAHGFGSGQTISRSEAHSPAAEVTSSLAIKKIRFPANALNYDKTSTIITQAATGLRWQQNFANGAFLTVPRPADWDGLSDVELRLHFTTTSSTSGAVQFFIRPRAYDPGDIFADVSSLSGAAVAVSQNAQVGEQVITIPAARFGTKNLWVVTIQRQGTQDTYPDDVVLMAVELRYTPPPNRIFLPLIIK